MARQRRLPEPGTPLLGRGSAVSELRALLQGGRTRLLTLTGAGGTGKSRLALELAAELAPSFNNIWFVDLTAVRSPDLVPSAIAQSVGVQESGARPLVTVLEGVLCVARSLILLDNFEHVMEAAPFVAELLTACPELTVIATSREALGLRSEHVYFVEPLPVPDLDHPERTAAIHNAPSVMLFEERARARKSSFQLTDEALRTVAQICIRLDGLPLAIELAAAQAAVLPPASILKRLEAREPLVGSIHRDLPARHQTFQSPVAWGYELLDAAEQQVFRACGVFAGGFTTEAAEHVCGASGNMDVLAVLAQLVSKSLVRVAEDGTDEPRFWLLETIRGFASDKLEQEDELAEARKRHAQYYVKFAESAMDDDSSKRIGAKFDRLTREYANFRAVFQWSSDTGQLELGLRLAVALYQYWLARGPLTEARAWLEAALVKDKDTTLPLRAAALNVAGGLAGLQVDHDKATDWFHQSLEIWNTLGDSYRVAGLQHNLGLMAHVTRNVDEAHRRFEISRKMYVALGDRGKQAMALGSLGRLARETNDLDVALTLTQQSLELYRAVGDQRGIAYQFANLGHVRLAIGDRGAAADAFRQALSLWRSLRNMIELAECLDGVAATLAVARPRRAVQLMGAAEAMRDRSGASVAAVEQRRYRALVDGLKSQLRDDAFEAGWREGRGLSLDQAMELALVEPAVEKRSDNGLSPRELETALLIARGASNAEISETLVVSVKTVETHIQHIFRKLNVKKRTEIAAWAVRENLV